MQLEAEEVDEVSALVADVLEAVVEAASLVELDSASVVEEVVSMLDVEVDVSEVDSVLEVEVEVSKGVDDDELDRGWLLHFPKPA